MVQGTPWTGIAARHADESEHLGVAQELAALLRREWRDAALTLCPEWIDARGFLWDGWRSHVRYTYRGYLPNSFEARVRIRPCRIERIVLHKEGKWCWDGEPLKPHWRHARLSTEDSSIDVLEDARCRYLWKANDGGTWHTELIADMLTYGHPYFMWGVADLVGCNSPGRALFKRSFRLPLQPYYHVTTGDPANVETFWGERRPLAA